MIVKNRTGKPIDWTLLGIYLILVLLGLSNIYSAVYDPEHASLFDLSKEYGKQSMWIGVSLFLGLIIMLLDGVFIIKNSYWVYAFTMLLLTLVLFTKPVNGAKSWFGFGSVGIQPSEFAKIGVSLALARYIGFKKILNKKSKHTNLSFSSFINDAIDNAKQNYKVLFILGLPSLLVLLQPDAGTFIVFTSFILMLYREGYAGNIIVLELLPLLLH